ncbi:MAG: carboxylating nicotinate-nucleotide diphosphorylase [Planctomycetaceae bacterium]|jgi:nicotinate-nucleotide pyrophosphorylase (carboxylating)|nr:carboxylating nicotinate-nucleotide diphosphorylase [Planctomycetaceae bacterium]
MKHDFRQVEWDSDIEGDLLRLIDIAVWEDRRGGDDLTSIALIPSDANGEAVIRVRQDGVIAGLLAVPTILKCIDKSLCWHPLCDEGYAVESDTKIGFITGSIRSILTAERIVLNLLGKLSGIATLTRQYVETISGTNVKIYDTRKTTLGWRTLEKYAVRCGGGTNHRTGLFDAVLIKDNHLAFGNDEVVNTSGFTPSEAVKIARKFLTEKGLNETALLEIEVDTLEQLTDALSASPDIVLLDNMKPEMLREAVTIRNKARQPITSELEASGGVNIKTVRAIAESGVERVSVGALTHSAIGLDIGLDYL